MKIKKKFLSVFIIASFCLNSTFIFVGCGDPEPPEILQENVDTFILTEVVESGMYINMDESKNDYIVINDDNTISLMHFDGQELAASYTEVLNEINMTEEEFCELMETPYDTIVHNEDVEGMYTISANLFGDDAPIRMNFKYNSKDKTILYHRCLYKIETDEQDD